MLSVALDWARTESSAMAVSTWCTRNVVGSSARQRTLIRCTQCQGSTRPLDSRPHREVQVGRDKLEVVASFCYLGDLLLAADCCEFSTTTRENCLEEVQGVVTGSFFPTPLFQDKWPCVQVCVERNAPCQ